MRKRILMIMLLAAIHGPAFSDDGSESEDSSLKIIDAASNSHADIQLDQFKWTARPFVVLAESPSDPRFAEQMSLLRKDPEPLVDRDVIVLVDTDPNAESELRKKLRPRGFMLVLIGKDGGVKLRKPFPWSVRELSRAIDKLPIRQQELRSR